jgi:hypothetical protein
MAAQLNVTDIERMDIRALTEVLLSHVLFLHKIWNMLSHSLLLYYLGFLTYENSLAPRWC